MILVERPTNNQNVYEYEYARQCMIRDPQDRQPCTLSDRLLIDPVVRNRDYRRPSHQPPRNKSANDMPQRTFVEGEVGGTQEVRIKNGTVLWSDNVARKYARQ